MKEPEISDIPDREVTADDFARLARLVRDEFVDRARYFPDVLNPLAELSVYETLLGNQQGYRVDREMFQLARGIVYDLMESGVCLETHTPATPPERHKGVVTGVEHPGPGPVFCRYCIETLYPKPPLLNPMTPTP